MADTKISALTDGAPAVATDVVPVSRTTDVATRRLTLANLSTLFATSLATVFAALVHATRHQNGGADQLSVAGLSGLLADAQTPLTENVQDIAGAMATDSGTIDFTYDDGAGTLTAVVKAASITEAMQVLADNTTQDATSTKHGYVPKTPAAATQFLNGAATAAYAQVKDSDLSISDIVTNDVSTSTHGFAPKAPNDATQFLNGVGAYAVPTDARIIIVTLGSDATAIDTTTGAEITGLQATATGTGTFAFKYVLRYQSTVTSVGVKFGINHTGTATVIASWWNVGASGAPDQTITTPMVAVSGSATRGLSTTAPDLGPTASVDTQDANMLAIIEGHLIVTATGDLELWFACETLTGDGTITIKTGSCLILTKVA